MTTFPSLTWPGPDSNTPREPARREPGRSAEVYGPQKRKPDTSAPPADEINTRQGQTPADGLRALVRAWGRILDPSAWISVGEEPDTRASRLIRWASLLAPVVIASVPLAIALFVASRGRVPWALASSDVMVPTLLTIYAIGCVLMAVALYTAPNGVVWALALLTLTVALTIALFTVVAGIPAGLLILALTLAILLVYSRARRTYTRPRTIEVTQLLDGWRRVLRPGYNILLPWERVFVTLSTPPRSYTTAPQEALLPGGNVVARAQCSLAYVISPQFAWRTAAAGPQWEDELRRRLDVALRQALERWRPPSRAASASAIGGSLTRSVVSDIRPWARAVGVRILSLRAHDIAVFDAANRPVAFRTPSPAPEPARAPRVTPTMPSTPLGAYPARPEPAAEPPPSPKALEDLYDAIRQRRITDPVSIRQVATEFATAAQVASRERVALPFDAVAASQALYKYADEMEHALQ